MQSEYWISLWERNETRFHQADVNPVLQQLWPTLELSLDKGVLVPLCGKSLDMRWLEAQGHQVWGVEIAEKPIVEFFADAGEAAVFETGPNIDRYRGERTIIYYGDYLQLQTPDVKGAGAVYDRAALVALPEDQRVHYADHILRIIPEQAVIVLLTIEYDQSLRHGPPFSVPEAEVNKIYGARASVELVSRSPTRGLPPEFIEAGVKDPVQCVYKIVKQK
jgi:thiopurine S-methyltransferase